jgi:hypothetical protein
MHQEAVGQQVPEGLHATNQTERGIVRHKRDGRYAQRSCGSAGSRRASRYQSNREWDRYRHHGTRILVLFIGLPTIFSLSLSSFCVAGKSLAHVSYHAG